MISKREGKELALIAALLPLGNTQRQAQLLLGQWVRLRSKMTEAEFDALVWELRRVHAPAKAYP